MTNLHVLFFPFMAKGHIIPTIDMAKLFSRQGVKATILTTPLTLPLFWKPIEMAESSDIQIDVRTINFPPSEAGILDAIADMDFFISDETSPETIMKFITATTMLQDPLERILEELQPDCLIADMIFPWATDAASKFNIPRVVFHGTCYFALCFSECMRLYRPYSSVSSDSEIFVVPGLPGEIEFTRAQMAEHERKNEETILSVILLAAKESELKSFGVVVNSFYELESVYADYYTSVMGRKAWHIGPVSLCNRKNEEKARRGGEETSVDEHECLKWLDLKKPNSVVYVCFGTVANLTVSQLREIALGLEASGQEFIWVVRKDKKNLEEKKWLPQGFEQRIEGKGLIVTGWAPQVLILDHEAVGGFVTHCGWNSTLEGIVAGKAMVTWPVAAEQFYNEKLVTHVLRIGVSVGAKHWIWLYGDRVESDAIEKAVKRIMVGKEGDEMRSRARFLGELARQAIQERGSSSSDLKSLIGELKATVSHQSQPDRKSPAAV